MNLQDILNDLTYGELANTYVSGYLQDEFESEPDPATYARLLSHINVALRQLYKEFFLRSEEHYIALSEEKTTYKLHTDYAQTNVDSPIDIADRYIMDTTDNPFYDNILHIESVFDEDGVELPLNDATQDLSVYTPNFRTIQVPYPEDGMTIAVQFRATHPVIPYTDETFDPSTVEVELPNSLHEALILYITGRMLRPMGGERTADSMAYFQLYKDSIQIVKDEGLEIQVEHNNERFEDRGWA